MGRRRRRRTIGVGPSRVLLSPETRAVRVVTPRAWPCAISRLVAVAREPVLLDSTQSPRSHAHSNHEDGHSSLAHAFIIGPPGSECWGHGLEEHNQDQSAGKSRGKAVDAGLQRRQIEEARARGMRRDDEYVIFPRW